MDKKRKRWVLWIDLEGTRYNWKNNRDGVSLKAISEVMNNLYYIGTNVYTTGSEKLFIHQCVDGFYVISDVDEKDLKRPISIATFLMRASSLQRNFLKASICMDVESFGDVSDCYPKKVRDKMENGIVSLGEGLMTFTRCMGKGTMEAYGLSTLAHGPLLIVEKSLRDRITCDTAIILNDKFIGINWLDQNLDLSMFKKRSKELDDAKLFRNILKDYIAKESSLDSDWIAGANSLLASS